MNVMGSEPFMQHPFEPAPKSAGSSLSQVLSDFAPRYLPDEMVEILPPEDESPEIEMFEPTQEASAEEMTPFGEDVMSDISALEPTIDLETLRQEAFAAGQEQQRSEMEEEFARQMEAVQEAHNAEIETLKNEAQQELVQAVETGIEIGLHKIETSLAQQVADILATFIGERLTQEAVETFSARITQEGLDAEMPLTVEGNQKLLDAFQAQETFDPARFILKPTDGREIRIIGNNNVLSTRVAPLLEELKELV